jgi:hypothetical protein
MLVADSFQFRFAASTFKYRGQLVKSFLMRIGPSSLPFLVFAAIAAYRAPIARRSGV